MAVWIKKYKLLYALTPRTASTATATALRKNLGGKQVPNEDIRNDAGKVIVARKHSKLSEIMKHELIDPADFNNAVRVTTVRNPFDSVYSLWYKKKYTYVPLLDDPSSFIHKDQNSVNDMLFVKENGFEEWFKKHYDTDETGKTSQGIYKRWTHQANHIMKFENLAEDFSELLDKLGVEKKFEIGILNPTEGRKRDYRTAYTDEMRQIGEKAFAAELKKYNYEF
ncbi:sulfotransferase family 2 domain-containing protein [Parvularcula flava]|uniref:Sulfotransferase family 2 domain-containing protein n=1 Tax=Aquisalinus luteolus TaxID=1566827 RepID=A0A8J3EPF6_9PROT|nr:sulfotransferase family 2 domain-containing protein [Aquisalinus luteolus]NHK28066.1 sulfotransferase family 2 domain-containing protein [Aquisalinus luteolus]GGH97350.1 hypothetical protein GCM10011355_18380 [Aquisalinus luteolus]